MSLGSLVVGAKAALIESGMAFSIAMQLACRDDVVLSAVAIDGCSSGLPLMSRSVVMGIGCAGMLKVME